MSSLYVRNTVEGWLADPAMQVPFYPTINEDQNPPDDMWCSVQYGNAYRERTTFCEDGIEEESEIEVIYMGRAGVGYQALLAAAEQDMGTLMAQRDLTNKLVLLQRSAPYEYTGGDASRYYGLSFYIDAVYRP